MESMIKIEYRKIVPIAAMVSAGKSMFLNVLFNFNILECKAGIATKFVNILRYNPNINSPCFYHLKIVKEGNDYIFYKDPNSEEVSGEEKIKEEIKNINNELAAKLKIEYEDLFYMTEINEAPFFRDKDYLLSHDLCDIPGLSEYNETNEENEKNKINENEINKDVKDREFEEKLKKGKEEFGLVVNIKEKEEKDSSINNEIRAEDDIFYDIKIENEDSYTTKIFNFIKNYIDGAIIVLSVEKFNFTENFQLIAKLHKVTQKNINNFLIILNKMDLSQNPDEDIEKCKGLLIQNFPKCKTFNINLNTFIAISTYQLQNELLMSKEFKYLINYHYFNYVSKVKITNNQQNTPLDKTFINHLIDILKANGINNEEIVKRVEELNESEKIDQINQELQSIIKNLKNYFQNFEINVGITEDDFSNYKDINLLDDDEDEDVQINNDGNIKPSYILKILYILYHEKKLIPSFSKETNKLLDYFRSNKEIQLFEESKTETNIGNNMNLFEIVNLLDVLLQIVKESKIDINVIDCLINEISLTIQYLKHYEFIYIPFLGPSNSGKTTLINGIIGKDILPTKMGECTKRGIIIKYNNSEEIIIRKANFKELTIFQKTFYYFEPDNIIGKGIDQVKETLNGLNYSFTDKKEDYFYEISTKIKLFDDMGLDDNQKNMIYLIDFPGYGTKNVFENEICKVMSICNSFIFVVRNSVIKENETKKILNQIFTQAKEQKKKSSSQYAKSCLFVFNNEEAINPTESDIDLAKSDIQKIINGLDKDSINLCFFNAKYYSRYCSDLSYFFNLKNSFSNELKNFSSYNNSIYICPEMIKSKICKTFCEYFSKLLTQKIKQLGFKEVNPKQKSDENVKNEIDEIFNEFSNSTNFGNGSKYKEKFIKLISFVRENINNLKIFKESNIKELKSCFSLQIFFANEDIQQYIIGKIDEITSILDLFFTKDITKREKDLKEKENFIKKMEQIQKDLTNNLVQSLKQIFSIDAFKTKVNNSLKEKENFFIQQLESKNYEQILEEIDNEIKINLKELNEQIKNFFDESEKQPLKLYNEASSIIQKFSDGKVNFPELSTFRDKFAKVFGNQNKNIDEQIFNEIKIASKDMDKIYEKRGFTEWIFSFIFSDNYLKNAYDIILDTFIDKINYILKLIIEEYEDYINHIKTLINANVKSICIQFNKDQKKFWDTLSTTYEEIRSSIIDIKLKINDEIYTSNSTKK